MSWSAMVLIAWIPAVQLHQPLEVGLVRVWFALSAQALLMAGWAALLGVLVRTEVALAALGALLFAGVFADEVILYAGESSSTGALVASMLYLACPDLDLLGAHALSAQGASLASAVWGILYSLTTAAALVVITGEVASQRDLRIPS